MIRIEVAPVAIGRQEFLREVETHMERLEGGLAGWVQVSRQPVALILRGRRVRLGFIERMLGFKDE